MKISVLALLALAQLYSVAMLEAKSPAAAEPLPLGNILNSDHRSEKNKSRDAYRHPLETLTFFGLKKDMQVVEIWPGGGWYTEIIAPFLSQKGRLYAAHFDPLMENRPRLIGALERFQSKIDDDPKKYARVVVTAFAPIEETNIAPPGSADMVLTFRNVHNWLRGGDDNAVRAFAAMYKALKSGGTLGVVEHRLRKSRGGVSKGGYMDQDYVIVLVEKAGFVFEASSEINANALDTTDHPKGVWTLPPSYRLKDKDREKYRAIGESDRMTLRFRKP